MVALAQTLVAATEQPGAGTGLFVDYIALAFHAHILHTYGNVLAVRFEARRPCILAASSSL